MRIQLYSTSDRAVLLEDLTSLATSCVINTALPGLYAGCSLDVGMDFVRAMDMFRKYVGVRLVVSLDNGKIVWDGIVWSMEIDLGGYTIGPRDVGSVWNYVAVEYTDVLNNNAYSLTSYVSDLVSQATFGIKEQLVSIGGATSVAAGKAVQKYINDHANPFSSGSLSVPVSGSSVTLKINGSGWWATTHYRKFQSIVTTTATVQARIQEIVNRTVVPAAPASTYYLQFFSTDTGLIEGTDLVVARATLHVDSIGNYLARTVSLGDNSNNVWYIGADVGSIQELTLPKIKVWKRPSFPTFLVETTSGKIHRADGQLVHPAEVRAGDYVQIVDLDPRGRSTPGGWQDRISGFILESTSYDIFSGTLTGKPEGQDIELNMIIARMGGG